MLISKKNRIAVYSYLFKEGAMVVKKDCHQAEFSKELRNSADQTISNLEVMCLLRSFASKGFCNVTFNWQYYYYYLTAEGIKYIREYLGLPDNVVPATLKKAAVAAAPAGPNGKKAMPSGDFKAEYAAKGGYKK